jgi:hypothetical protein
MASSKETTQRQLSQAHFMEVTVVMIFSSRWEGLDLLYDI